MGSESASPAARRLAAVALCFLATLCVVGGYMLCGMSQSEVKRRGEIVTVNLTIAAENLYKRAKRITPKVLHHNDPEKVTEKLLKILNCTLAGCGAIANDDVAEFIKRTMRLKVAHLIKSVNNASIYLESLR